MKVMMFIGGVDVSMVICLYGGGGVGDWVVCEGKWWGCVCVVWKVWGDEWFNVEGYVWCICFVYESYIGWLWWV